MSMTLSSMRIAVPTVRSSFSKLSVPVADVKMVAIGDFGAGLTALEHNKADIAIIPEPIYSQKMKAGAKYQIIPWLDAKLPPQDKIEIAPDLFGGLDPWVHTGVLVDRARGRRAQERQKEKRGRHDGPARARLAMIRGVIGAHDRFPSRGSAPTASRAATRSRARICFRR